MKFQTVSIQLLLSAAVIVTAGCTQACAQYRYPAPAQGQNQPAWAAPAPYAMPGTNAPRQYSKALNDINQEAYERQNRAANGLNRANAKLQDADYYSGNIRSSAAAHASNMSAKTDGNGRPVYSQGYIDQYLQLRNQKANNLQSAMYSEANQINENAQKRAAAVQDQASNLQQQLQESASGTSSFHIVPEGTNLFVQNYATTQTSTPPATPLRATLKTLKAPRSTSRDVRGQIVGR